MTEYVHLKTGNKYRFIGEANNCTNGQDNKPMVVYEREGKIFVRDKAEFHEKFKVEPNRCHCCGTTENLHKDGWYGYRCDDVGCMVL